MKLEIVRELTPWLSMNKIVFKLERNCLLNVLKTLQLFSVYFGSLQISTIVEGSGRKMQREGREYDDKVRY